MKTAIVYYSAHHNNTKKLLDAIAESNDVTLIDVIKDKTADLSQYDRIGFASGIYYSSFAKQLLAYTEEKLPNGKDVFYIATYGTKKPSYYRTISKIAESKGCKEIGRYGCLGLSIMNNNIFSFTALDIQKGCQVTMKQASNLIV